MKNNKIIYVYIMLITFLSLGMVTTEVNAGILSKIAKGMVVKKALGSVAKQSAKNQPRKA